MNKKVLYFCIIAIIAAMYTAVSLALAPLSFGNIQIRIAECLTMLPLIFAPSIYGVILGCFLTNLIGAFMGVNLLGFLDVIVGTLATALAAFMTYKLRNIKIKNIPIFAILMPVIFNGVIIGVELGYVLFPQNFLLGSLICGVEVAIGELVSVIVGYFIVKALAPKIKAFL
ncbi:MAG: QueT transporter family protein [Erysipelotrichaceae bacterium]|nr:QueT transporter family protein [Erysipelotrichaceae bacterium]MDY5251214.1 QueT transporter family protein [Erysipelotrichaceae bacterium]